MIRPLGVEHEPVPLSGHANRVDELGGEGVPLGKQPDPADDLARVIADRAGRGEDHDTAPALGDQNLIGKKSVDLAPEHGLGIGARAAVRPGHVLALGVASGDHDAPLVKGKGRPVVVGRRKEILEEPVGGQRVPPLQRVPDRLLRGQHVGHASGLADVVAERGHVLLHGIVHGRLYFP